MVRLALIPQLHTGNSFRVMVSSLVLILAALCGYQFASSVAALIVLRVLHGAGFVLLVSAATVLLVGLIPEGRSGQAFAAMSIAWLVPYAVIPPVFGALLSHFRNEAELYARFAVLIVPGVMVLFAARRRVEKGLAACASRRPPLSDCLLALRRRPSPLILAIGFSLFFSNTTVFFMQEFFTRSRYGQAGPFFALSAGPVIATRIGPQPRTAALPGTAISEAPRRHSDSAVRRYVRRLRQPRTLSPVRDAYPKSRRPNRGGPVRSRRSRGGGPPAATRNTSTPDPSRAELFFPVRAGRPLPLDPPPIRVVPVRSCNPSSNTGSRRIGTVRPLEYSMTDTAAPVYIEQHAIRRLRPPTAEGLMQPGPWAHWTKRFNPSATL